MDLGWIPTLNEEEMLADLLSDFTLKQLKKMCE